MKPSRGLDTFAHALSALAAVNCMAVALLGGYDIHVGPVHLAAHEAFKPILYLGGALLVALLLRSTLSDERDTSTDWTPPAWAGAACAILVYAGSVFINPTRNNDWIHQASTADLHGPLDLLRFFVWRQPDGFYRPLTFLSMSLDRFLFGERPEGYHLQNIALHALNAWLLTRLARRLGLSTSAARWAGMLFAVAAINYEPVMWPGARFDLLAACFSMLALTAGIDYLDAQSARRFAALAGCFAAGVLCKESAYATAPIFFLICVWRGSFRRGLVPLGALVAIAAVAISIRLAIFGSLGGYPDASGVAPHFALSLKTFTSFFTRALPSPVFLINTSASLPWYARLAVVLLGAGIIGVVWTARSSARTQAFLLCAALAASLPAANLVDWIGPIAHNTRYVYFTSAWIVLFIANAARDKRWLALVVLANALGAFHNLHAFEWIDPGVRPVALKPGSLDPPCGIRYNSWVRLPRA